MMRHSNSLGGRASSFRMDFSDKPYDVFTYSVLHYSNSCFSLCSFKKKKNPDQIIKAGTDVLLQLLWSLQEPIK